MPKYRTINAALAIMLTGSAIAGVGATVASAEPVVAHDKAVIQEVTNPLKIGATITKASAVSKPEFGDIDKIVKDAANHPVKVPGLKTAPKVERKTKPAPKPKPKVVKVDKHKIVAEKATSVKGTPYVWGGSSPQIGFDCSGLIVWSYKQIGIILGRSTYDQVASLPAVHDLRVGDLLFNSDSSHVGMYIGNKKVIHAPTSGDVVKIVPLSSFNYSQIRRVNL